MKVRASACESGRWDRDLGRGPDAIPWAVTSLEDWRRLPYVSAAQMAKVDEVAVRRYGIDLLQMMENAGRALALLARERFLASWARGARVIVLAGPGGNGGGALAAARRLHGWGSDVAVYLSRGPGRLSPATAHQLRSLQRVGIRPAGVRRLRAASRAELVVDGLMGYGLSGAPREPEAAMIRWANDRAVPVLSLDLPSGVDATSGCALRPAIRACATLTLAATKLGLLSPDALKHVGELYLADIGIPRQAFEDVGIDSGPSTIFSRADIVRVG